jgi:hypothetical protein
MTIPGRTAPRLIPIPAQAAARPADSSAWDAYFGKNGVSPAQLRELVERRRRAGQTGQVKAALRAYLRRFPKNAEPWMSETLAAILNAYWREYYQKHDEKASALLETIAGLGRARQFDEVEAAVTAYLTYHPKKAEPWMYETLAVALDLNKQPPEKVRQALGYAAYLADQSRNPSHMVSVADLLMVREIYEPYEIPLGTRKVTVGAGPLLDRAAELAPHLPAPLMMSVNLGLKAKDPKRMADALERLLALGWPGLDETMRLQARQAAETLAKELREADRSPEADTLLARVTAAEGRDLFVRLTWTGEADLDLTVEEPLGTTASHALPRTVFGGAIVKEGRGGRYTEEVYTCPRGFDGDYTIRVVTIANVSDEPTQEATLEVITHEGMPDEHAETHTIALDRARPIVVHLTGGRRKTVLPFMAPPHAPASLATKPPRGEAKAARKAAEKAPARPEHPPIVVPPGDPPSARAGRPR